MAGEAGAVYASAAKVHLSSCLFDGNSADPENGGGVFVDSVTDMLVDSCSFINNSGLLRAHLLYVTYM